MTNYMLIVISPYFRPFIPFPSANRCRKIKTGRWRRWMPWNSSIVNSNVRLYNSILEPTSDHLRSAFPISETYFGPPPKWLSDSQNLLWTTSEVAFRFSKPTSDHLRSAFPISKPTSDHLRSAFSISKTASGNMYKLYFLHLWAN